MRLKLLLVQTLLITAVCLRLFAAHVSADESIRVGPGDNLYRIALRYGTTVDQLVRANGLASPDHILLGQRLVIPTGAGGVVPSYSQSVQTAAPSAVSSPARGTHIVQPGEHLYRIALSNGTSVDALVAANGLASADVIQVGQQLVIPGGGGTAAVGGGSDGSIAAAPPAPSFPARAGRQVVVDLSSQTVSAVENGQAVASFTASTGTAYTPTPMGHFRITNRYSSQRMIGPGYDLPGVPYVQYFTGSYALHGTYWHSNFGTPMSHGCINLRVGDAAWLWQWAGIGTEVVVQP